MKHERSWESKKSRMGNLYFMGLKQSVIINIGNSALDKFDFYDIDNLIIQGVNEELLRQIVAEANRFKAVQNGQLTDACMDRGLPTLSRSYPHKWNDEIDAFVKAHLGFSGKFKVGDTVVYTSSCKKASDWFKRLVGLEAKIIRAWTDAQNRSQYELEIVWNKHKTVTIEESLIAVGASEPPWWCKKATVHMSTKLTVELKDYQSPMKLIGELSEFTKSMREFGNRELHLMIMVADKRALAFTITYDKKASFYLNGQRSNRKAVISALSEYGT